MLGTSGVGRRARGRRVGTERTRKTFQKPTAKTWTKEVPKSREPGKLCRGGARGEGAAGEGGIPRTGPKTQGSGLEQVGVKGSGTAVLRRVRLFATQWTVLSAVGRGGCVSQIPGSELAFPASPASAGGSSAAAWGSGLLKNLPAVQRPGPIPGSEALERK